MFVSLFVYLLFVSSFSLPFGRLPHLHSHLIRPLFVVLDDANLTLFVVRPFDLKLI